ncbi:bacteriohemerythrin, partial [candidate division KSB1 bacterium]
QYLDSLDKGAGKEYLDGREGSQRSFRVCPFCGKKFDLIKSKLDKRKDYAIEWNSDLDLGVPIIDNQHRKLLQSINSLLNAIIREEGFEEAGKAIKFLQDYTKAHFATEESTMLKYAYIDYDIHRKQHQIFKNKISKYAKRHADSGSTKELATKLAKELWGWFKNHIQKVDKKFGVFVKIKTGKEDPKSFDEIFEDMTEALEN